MPNQCVDTNHQARLKRGQRIALTATVATLVLALGKAFVGWRFASPVLIADAFHSGADLLAIFASFFGLWLAGREKTEQFPYGLYRVETFVTLLAGAVICWAGFELIPEGWSKLGHVGENEILPTWPMLASGISMAVSLAIAVAERRVGRAINSQSLQVNASESFLDIATSAVVLLGLLLNYLGIRYVEGTVILLIAGLIVKLGWSSVRQSFLALLDANLDPELTSAIEKRVNEIYGVKGVSEVRIRQAGPFRMVDCVIYTSPTLPLYRAHHLADLAETAIRDQSEHVESVFVHVEPAVDHEMTVIIPVKDINGFASHVHGHFGRAPYFVAIRLNGRTEAIEDFYSNQYLEEKKFIGLKVIKTMLVQQIDLLFTASIGEISFYMLKDNLVDIYRIAEGQTVRDVLAQFHNKELPAITSPTHSVDESLVE
ncbi:divalent cation efflux pump membrane protein, iron-molybdenum-binding domain-containing, putative [Syntrophotalea carbinolica DSM 2380]|uniref:Divalent cation efflux pump membrane protein, iron-molybdenum-binding domain-containing, putative n=1 Tax=Syntrophotalea carbinolica (strain DSM 2380 / NBRC 103641 / GraBd1) TaxID=338963 RepID=Q3A6B2_SYNC1|nr:cation diffusion facilitator family transporter [Syntrophotalea carbinolica]ABA88095.1 divalent cation efflux pump membrane protein, iron-molybdenum-binding domain-containing, putative [Syntrophotalea carbinolica DSM 2380]